MSDSTLASFTVNKENWKAFKELASEQGRSASNCLNQLIEQALHKNDIVFIDSGDIIPIVPTDFISRSEFDQALNDLKFQIENLEQKINHPTGFSRVSVPVRVNPPKTQKEGDRRQKILELMGYVPACPDCGSESISKEGHGKGKGSHRFRCVNVDCSRQTFTAYPNNLGYL